MICISHKSRGQAVCLFHGVRSLTSVLKVKLNFTLTMSKPIFSQSLFSYNGVPQRADVFDFDLDPVARLQKDRRNALEPDSVRCAGHNDRSREQRHIV